MVAENSEVSPVDPGWSPSRISTPRRAGRGIMASITASPLSSVVTCADPEPLLALAVTPKGRPPGW